MDALRFQNPRIQRLRRLLGRRSARSEEGAFVVEGAKILTEALDAQAFVECVFVSADALGLELDALVRVRALDIEIVPVDPAAFTRIFDVDSPQPICAILRRIEPTLMDLHPGLKAGGLVVVGVDIRDPGNAGTLIRSAEASGAVGVVFCADSVDVRSPKVVRSSAGALFHVPVVTGESLGPVLALFRSWGVRSWATAVRPGSTVAHFDADLRGPTAVVFGNEGHGLGPEDLDAVDALLTIPMPGRSESLNVSMSATVVCFEAARQRAIGMSLS